MNLPICFHEEKKFSISINTIGKHFIDGVFSIGDFKIRREFQALLYQPEAGVYNFTFTINWLVPAANTFTIFCATLNTNRDNNILNLNWLLLDNLQLTVGSGMLLGKIPSVVPKNQPLPYPALSDINTYLKK